MRVIPGICCAALYFLLTITIIRTNNNLNKTLKIFNAVVSASLIALGPCWIIKTYFLPTGYYILNKCIFYYLTPIIFLPLTAFLSPVKNENYIWNLGVVYYILSVIKMGITREYFIIHMIQLVIICFILYVHTLKNLSFLVSDFFNTVSNKITNV